MRAPCRRHPCYRACARSTLIPCGPNSVPVVTRHVSERVARLAPPSLPFSRNAITWGPCQPPPRGGPRAPETPPRLWGCGWDRWDRLQRRVDRPTRAHGCICRVRVACASTAVRICTNLKPSKWCCVFVFYTLVMILGSPVASHMCSEPGGDLIGRSASRLPSHFGRFFQKNIMTSKSHKITQIYSQTLSLWPR